ncbi:MAG: hypothetical protein P8K68_00765 [Algibacter sp.]|uniref:hypothetical protein n=1 Tax=Algibacter sp. TaxID=1872428 RepID=UPI002607ACF8|nr:hypothetical protein [Algibacter sp.]MDG1728660.1 hypothetical protein [Algibacter sp.]MDG2177304.1 hypothetical protein [Algibacter sp.]
MNHKITFIIAFFILSTLKAQTTFDWEASTAPTTDNGNNVTQTIDGITTTFTGTENPGVVAGPGGGFVLTSSESNTTTSSVTFSFSEAVDVTSISTLSGPTITYTFSPTGGSNSQVVEPVGGGEETVNLNWTGVTSFAVTGSTNFIVGFNDLIVSSSTLSTNNFNQEIIPIIF